MDGWMDALIDRWMDVWVNARMDGCKGGRTDEWVDDGWIEAGRSGRMGECAESCIKDCGWVGSWVDEWSGG